MASGGNGLDLIPDSTVITTPDPTFCRVSQDRKVLRATRVRRETRAPRATKVLQETRVNQGKRFSGG